MNGVCSRSVWRQWAWQTAITVAGSLVVAIGWAKSPETKAERLAHQQEARAAVQEALLHEVYGLEEDRERLLEEAAAADPSLAAAQWHRGLIQDPEGKWVRFDDFKLDPIAARQLADYRELRAGLKDTPEANWKLANWCATHGMPLRERAHLLHLTEAVPNHPEARARLGMVRVGDNWYTRDEAVRQQQRLKDMEAGMVHWRPILRDISNDLRHRSEMRKKKAAERLAEIREPGAIPAIDDVLMTAREDQALIGVQTLHQIPGEEASLALCRHAILSSWQSVREAAADCLRTRPFHEFIPELLTMLSEPIESRFVAITLPNGSVNYQHAFVRESQDRRDVMVLNTAYQRIARRNGYGQATVQAELNDAARSAAEREMAARVQNAITAQANERIMWVLSRATGKAFFEASAWWDWWNKENDIAATGDKSINYAQRTTTKQYVDYVPQYNPSDPQSSDSGNYKPPPPSRLNSRMRPRVRSSECLAAGTPIWTVEGKRPIEEMRVGDLVLAKDVDTGELTFKPVIATTVRPRGPLVRLQIGKDTFSTSQGHLFWVSGEGWVKASNLESGVLLHTADGPVRISSVEPDEAAETYNVVVADFSTYFVGDERILSHDVTLREPTLAVVPGLIVEP